LFVEVSVSPYVFSSYGLPNPIFVMSMGSDLSSEDALGTLNSFCIPVCRLLLIFAKTKNNDEVKSDNYQSCIESLFALLDACSNAFLTQSFILVLLC
jgi:hypothetical protein